MTKEKIEVGRIVAKLRNTVPVCLMENGTEVKRYNNIEFPDELKTLEMSAFGFNIGADDKITFHLCFDAGVLPEDFPEKRKSISRADAAAAKAAATVNTADLAGAAADAITAATGSEVKADPIYTEARFNVTGDRRKELVAAMVEILGVNKKYEGVATQAFVVGDCRIDKAGTVTGEIQQALIDALADRGFTAEAAI